MERPAFDRLLTAQIPIIEKVTRRYANKYNCYHDWEDIAQSSFLKMLRSADQYDPDKGKLLPWACVVIINTIRSRIVRTLSLPNTVDFNAQVIESISASCNPEDDMQANLIISKLNREAKLYFEGYNYREIAHLVGVRSKATVMTRIDNCTNLLRYILGITTERARRKKNVY